MKRAFEIEMKVKGIQVANNKVIVDDQQSGETKQNRGTKVEAKRTSVKEGGDRQGGNEKKRAVGKNSKTKDVGENGGNE